MKRLIVTLVLLLWAVRANAQSSNTYVSPPAGQPNLAHIGISNPPAPVITGAGASGGSTTYQYAVVAYGHDASGNLIPTLIGATAQTTTANPPLSAGNPIVLTTQADPGAAQYDFLKLWNGSWQSICLGVTATGFLTSGTTCSDTGQVPQAYTLPTANATVDLVSPYASIANLNVTQTGVPINQAPPQTASYNAHGNPFENMGCPDNPQAALVEGCPIGLYSPAQINSASGALNGTLGQTTANPAAVTSLTASGPVNLSGAVKITGSTGSTMDNVPIGSVTPSSIVASTMKLPGTGSVGCLQADALGNFSITNAACGTGGGGGGSPGGGPNVIQTNSGSGTFGAYAGSGPLTTHNFANQITNTGTLLGAQPAFTDISGTCQVSQGCTGATSAGAAAANGIGALAQASNLSDLANASTARSNLGVAPAIGSPGALSPLEQDINHALSTTSATVACTSNAGGSYPSWDWYSGKLSGNNVTYTLPGTASNCLANDAIGFAIVQDASHTVTFSPGSGTQIPATTCPGLATGADAIGEYYFVYNPSSSTPSWVEHCASPAQVNILNQNTTPSTVCTGCTQSTNFTLFTYTVPAGTLGTAHSLDLVLHGGYLNTTSADTPTVSISYGGTNIAGTVALTSAPSNSAERTIWIRCHLAAANATNSQTGFCNMWVGTPMANANWEANLVNWTSQNNAMAVDSTTGQAFAVTYNDGSSANSTLKFYSAYVESR